MSQGPNLNAVNEITEAILDTLARADQAEERGEDAAWLIESAFVQTRILLESLGLLNVLPVDGTLHDLPVDAGVGTKVVSFCPIFEVEQIAEELKRLIFRQASKPERRSEIAGQQRRCLPKIHEHPRVRDSVVVRILLGRLRFRRFERQTPMQIDPAEPCIVVKEGQTIFDEGLSNLVAIAIFARQIATAHHPRVLVEA